MRRIPVRLTTLAAALVLVAPLLAEAQSSRVWRIGYLTSVVADGARIDGLKQRLRELGYTEGYNVVFEVRSSDGKAERCPELAGDLVRLKVDVIVASGNAAIEATRQATRSIPIVMLAATDSVAAGFAASLVRPRGNITGLTVQSSELMSKALQLLKEALPNLFKVAVLWEPVVPRTLAELEAAATLLGIQLQTVEMRDLGELDGALTAAARNHAAAAVIMADNMTFAHRTRIAEVALKRRLPTVGLLPDFGESGWLMGYGASLSDQLRRTADFLDRIFKGAKPTDLPIEQSTKFHFVINLRTAKALGINIPPPLLQRADEVIK